MREKKLKHMQQRPAIIEAPEVTIERIGDPQDRGQQTRANGLMLNFVAAVGVILLAMPATYQRHQCHLAQTKRELARLCQLFDHFLADDMMALALYHIADIMKERRRAQQLL